MFNQFGLTFDDIDCVIQIAWEHKKPFYTIRAQYGLPEAEVVRLMRSEMNSSSFNLWKQKVFSDRQYKISF